MRPELQRMLTRAQGVLETGNLARFLVALILAFALWAYVTNKNDPETSRTIPAVPVSAVNVPKSLRVIGPLDTVEVGLRGPQSRINAIDTGIVVAQVDLQNISKPGTYFLTVHVSAPSGVDVREVTPAKIQVQVERKIATLPFTTPRGQRNLLGYVLNRSTSVRASTT